MAMTHHDDPQTAVEPTCHHRHPIGFDGRNDWTREGSDVLDIADGFASVETVERYQGARMTAHPQSSNHLPCLDIEPHALEQEAWSGSGIEQVQNHGDARRPGMHGRRLAHDGPNPALAPMRRIKMGYGSRPSIKRDHGIRGQCR